MTVQSNYTVVGMTCGHCVDSVRTELTAMAGVRDVRVDLASGRVDVESEQPLSEAAVREAVVEAGYALADA